MSLCRIRIDAFSLFLIIWLSFVCLLPGVRPSPRRCGLYLSLCTCTCVGVSVGVRLQVFMCNMQLFSAFQLLITWEFVKPQRPFGRWILAERARSVHLGLARSLWNVSKKAGRSLLSTTLGPSEDERRASATNPNECVFCDPVLSEHLQLIQVWLRGGGLRSLPNTSPLTAIVFPSD